MDAYQPAVTSVLTPEDSKRVADAAIEAAQEMSRRWDAMCAQLEQTAYIKANPTRY